MAKIKVNGKQYDMPRIGFEHMQKLEDEGFDIITMFKKKQMFSMVSAAIVLCTGCDVDTANHLAEQHVLGGGKFGEIIGEFTKALGESDFFQKYLASMNVTTEEAEK